MVTTRTTSLTFNNSTFCPHSVIVCFVWIWEQTAIISLYSINWLVLYNTDLTLYSSVGTICTTSLTFKNSTFCPLSVFMCFVWIWEQTAIISLYSKNWLVLYNTDLTLYSPVGTICTTSLTFKNSTFCPHSVFMCFVWIWEQTAIISLYSNNWLVLYNTDLTLYSPVVTICTTSLTFNNSTFFPHTNCIYVFCEDLRINSDYFPIQH